MEAAPIEVRVNKRKGTSTKGVNCEAGGTRRPRRRRGPSPGGGGDQKKKLGVGGKGTGVNKSRRAGWGREEKGHHNLRSNPARRPQKTRKGYGWVTSQGTRAQEPMEDDSG